MTRFGGLAWQNGELPWEVDRVWGRERIQAQFVPLLYHVDCINVDIFVSCKKFCFPKNECGGQIGYKHILFYSLLPSIDCVCDYRRVCISGGTLRQDNCQLIGQSLIVLARHAQKDRN